MWWSKKNSTAPDRNNEAKSMTAEATKELKELKAQGPYVTRLSTQLIERREENHFGDSIQVTFTPRGKNK